MATRGGLEETAAGDFVVRPKVWTGWLAVLLVLGIGSSVFAAIVFLAADTRPAAAVVALVIGLLLIAFAVAAALHRRRLGWRIAVSEAGIEVKGRTGAVALAFREIAALGLATRDAFSNGTYSGIHRRLQLWRQQDPVRRPSVDVQAFCKANAPEEAPFGNLIDRLVDEAVARIEALLADGQVAKGVGLQLAQATLRIGSEAIPLERITAAGLHGGRFCLWLDADAEPRYRLDPNLPNVLPIMRIVQKRIAERSADHGTEVAGLGRILFERRASRTGAILVLLLGIATVWLGVGILAILWGWHLLVFRFRCHERGVYRRGLFGRRELLYQDVETFTFSAVRQYYNGAYIGTSTTMKFLPEPGSKAKPIHFSRSVRNADRDIDDLRDHVAKVVAARLLARLADGTPITWGADAVILPQALRYRPTKFIGKGDWTEMPYEQVAGCSLKDGVLAVFAKGKEKAVLRLPVSVVNFFPGYTVFCDLLAAVNGQAEAPPPGV